MRHLLGKVTLAGGVFGLVVSTALAAGAATPPASGEAASQAAAAPDQHWAFLNQYCSKCHNAEDWAGGVAFDTMSPGDIGTDAKIWENAVSKLRGRIMPPAGNPQPTPVAVHDFVGWMEGNLDQAAAHRVDAPRVPLHRMNRTEYANAVWDLLRVRVDADQLLPPDDQAEGFNNVASVLQVSPAFVDAYVSAARQVVVDALGNREAGAVGVQFPVPASEGGNSQEYHVDGLPLGTRGGMSVTYNFPADGEYELNIANMAGALWVTNQEFDNHLIATYDGKKFFDTHLGGGDDLKGIDQKQDVAVDAINARLKHIKFKAQAGPHHVAVTFVHRTFAASEDRLDSLVPGGAQDRVERLTSFEIKGPYNITGVSDFASRERVFVCKPASAADEPACASKIITSLTQRAFRRPVTDADTAPLLKFYEAGHKAGGFEEGIRRALTALLASPSFLYRAEVSHPGSQLAQGFVGVAPAQLRKVVDEQPAQSQAPKADAPKAEAPKADAPSGISRLSDEELASRLSFFLWSAPPDQELLALAAQNKLHEPAVLKAQVDRLLADPQSITLASNFAYQWLDIERLDEIKPDPSLFPYAADPRADYKTEVKLFVDSVFRENHAVTDLLTANWTYLNERTALMYGIRDVKGDTFRRVQLTPAQSARYGLLGKGAILMGTSYPNRTAPVLRGQWVLASITGTPPDAPPPGVPSLKDNKTGEKALTLRELMAKHRDRPSCFACHGILDPLGFAFENFDAVGVWRDKDRMAGTEIDASGVLPDGTKISGIDDLRKALVDDPTQFVQTLTSKLMTYGIGRTMDYQDMPTIRAIVRESARQGYHFEPLIMDIVTSTPFQMRTSAEAAAPVKTAALIR